jgi:GNAT superfamily N-acetyltransferase
MDMDVIEVSQSEADAQVVRQKLNEFNFNLVPHDNHEILNLIVRRGNAIIAGLIGDTYWNWLYISLFWVERGERHRGLGTQILAKAEEIAVQRGCRNAHLETHDFQNLEFYQKQGYVIFGKLEDLPEGHTKYYLRKRLIKVDVQKQENRPPVK